MAHECVECGRQTAPGALTCPHCGADRPHRNRALRAEVVARRRRLILFGILAGVVVWAALIVFGGGTSRSRECRDYDSASAEYDQRAAAAEPDEVELATLRTDLERLRLACQRSEG